MKAKPNPYAAAQNDNIGRFTTPNHNSTNMGITNIVRAHRERKRNEKVNIIAEGTYLGEKMCAAEKIVLKR